MVAFFFVLLPFLALLQQVPNRFLDGATHHEAVHDGRLRGVDAPYASERLGFQATVQGGVEQENMSGLVQAQTCVGGLEWHEKHVNWAIPGLANPIVLGTVLALALFGGGGGAGGAALSGRSELVKGVHCFAVASEQQTADGIGSERVPQQGEGVRPLRKDEGFGPRRLPLQSPQFGDYRVYF